MYQQSMVEWITRQMKYDHGVGSIISFKYWDSAETVRVMMMYVDGGMIISSSVKHGFDWVAINFRNNKNVHLKNEWIVNLTSEDDLFLVQSRNN